jgi:anaerobic glycerol-3-phosphate dehydrogenase
MIDAELYDVAIIGGGLAGLACRSSLQKMVIALSFLKKKNILSIKFVVNT